MIGTQSPRDDASVSRRDLLQVSTGTAVLAGAAGLIGATQIAAAQETAQTLQNVQFRTGEANPFYEYSALPSRPKLKWPNGARVAVHIVPNVEHLEVFDRNRRMDVRNYPRYDYGNRVAIWRLFEVFAERRIPLTIAMNAAVSRHYPEIMRACLDQGHEIMGHGITNSERLDALAPIESPAVIREALNTLRAASGQSVRGWLGPGLMEVDGTLEVLKANGIEYVCDWGAADDQPFPMRNGLHAIPYTLDINDLGLIDRQGTPASQFAAYIVDAFDTLYAEGADQARVLPIAIHPFLTGAAHRVPHLVKALDYIRGHDAVWFARGGDILDAYKTATGA
jgi:peptidoglycan/xylan/chitin deacetylase (PgdA/CDA1 family)